MNFFTTQTTELDVDEMIIKPIKKEPKVEENSIGKHAEESINKDWFQEDQKIDPDNMERLRSDSICDAWNDSLLINPKTDLPHEILNQTSPPKKRIMKYMDPTTGKIYYLEMDRNLDISKVQEIIINSKGNTKTARISPISPVKLSTNGVKNIRRTPKKSGASLLKPEVTSLFNNTIKCDKRNSICNVKSDYSHIENDHCYISTPKHLFFNSEENSVLPEESLTVDSVASDKIMEDPYKQLCCAVERLTCIRTAVNYLLSKIPLISDVNKEYFPFMVNSEEKYWTLDVVKRRSMEVIVLLL